MPYQKGRPILRASLPLLLLAVAPLTAHADIKLNGFASIRGVQTSTDGGLEPFPGYTEGEFDFKSESLFAIQAQADLADKLSATVQLYADGQKDFDLEARWAYLSYQINDQHRLSAGRFANPIFHQSEYEKVGYAHNFARLPKAVYIGFDFSTVEGMALDSQYNFGDYNLQTKLLYGSWDGETFSAVTNSWVNFGLKDIMSLNVSLNKDWWTVFAGAFTAEIDGATIDSGTVFPLAANGINLALANGATPQQVTDLKSRIGWDKKDGIYWFSGFAVDYNNWLVDYEYAYWETKDSSDAPNTSWYAAVGYRFDKYVVTVHHEDYAQDTDFGYLDGVAHPILLATGKGIQTAFASREFDANGITLRYDFHPSAALKIDYLTGSDTRAAVGDYQMMSIGVDLVF